MEQPTPILVEDVDGSSVQGYKFADGKIVCVDHNVWMLDANCIQITGPSGADYYYSECGYNCATAEEVAVTFHSHT